MFRIIRDSQPIKAEDIFRMVSYFTELRIIESSDNISIVKSDKNFDEFVLVFDRISGEISAEIYDDHDLRLLFFIKDNLSARIVSNRFITFRNWNDEGYIHKNDKILYRNNRIKEIFGIRRIEILGWSLSIFLIYLVITNFDIYYQFIGHNKIRSPEYYEKIKPLFSALEKKDPHIYVMPTYDFGAGRARALVQKLQKDTGLSIKLIDSLWIGALQTHHDDIYEVNDIFEISINELIYRRLGDRNTPVIILTNLKIIDKNSNLDVLFTSEDTYNNISIITGDQLTGRDFLFRKSRKICDIRIEQLMNRAIGSVLFKLTSSEDPSSFMFRSVRSPSDVDGMETF